MTTPSVSCSALLRHLLPLSLAGGCRNLAALIDMPVRRSLRFGRLPELAIQPLPCRPLQAADPISIHLKIKPQPTRPTMKTSMLPPARRQNFRRLSTRLTLALVLLGAARPALADPPPIVTAPTSAEITATSATLGGTVADPFNLGVDGRGVVYALTSVNTNPIIGGSGVTQVPASGMSGVFTVPVFGLTPGTAILSELMPSTSAGRVTPSRPPSQLASRTSRCRMTVRGPARICARISSWTPA